MPPSATSTGVRTPAGQNLAVAAEILYLVNLLFVPVVAFVALFILYQFKIRRAPPLAACHLRQTLSASIWAGVILVLINLVIITLGGYQSSWTWLIVILYFTVCHASLVLLGAIGLAKAMAGQNYRYPLVGRPCDD